MQNLRKQMQNLRIEARHTTYRTGSGVLVRLYPIVLCLYVQILCTGPTIPKFFCAIFVSRGLLSALRTLSTSRSHTRHDRDGTASASPV